MEADVTKELTRFQRYTSQLFDRVFDSGVKIVVIVVLFLIGRCIIKLIKKLIRRSLEKSAVDNGNIGFIESTVSVALYVVLIGILAGYFGVETASLVAVLGSAGLTIGLAFQGSLSNFAGGVLILITKPFKLDDYIIISDGSCEGTVSEIGIFFTRLTTVDNKSIVIPNGVLSNTTLVNATYHSSRKLEIVVGISYDADIKKAKNVLLELLKNEECVITDEEIQIFVNSLGDSSVDIGMRFFVKKSEYWTSKWMILEDIKEAFDKNGIPIPYNQLDVHLDN